MRLIKLKIKNIASLRGEHEINFADIQKESSLFAITGETGSGKSTILNSIGLVLYGKVYKSNINQNDFVTLGEKEGGIELIFQAAGKIYYAIWKVKTRKQNGEFYSTPQVPTRELYQMEAAEFNSPKVILNEKAENILQLDFDQFCKCIILNQGEFARFLTANFTERKEILEKLYPGELIDSLSNILKKEKDDLEKEIRDIDIELHALKGPEEEGEALTEKINELTTKTTIYDNWVEIIEKLAFNYSSLITYHQKNNENLSKVGLLKEGLAKETTQFNNLSKSQSEYQEELDHLKSIFDEKRPLLQELLKEEEKLRFFKAELAKNTTLKNNLEQELKSLLENKDKNQLKLEEQKREKNQLEKKLVHNYSLLKRIDLIDLFEKWNIFEQKTKEFETKKEILQKNKEIQLERTNKIQALEVSTSKINSIKNEVEGLKKEEVFVLDKINQNTSSNEKLADLENKKNLALLGVKAAEEEFSLKSYLKNEGDKKLENIQKELRLGKLLSAIEECLTHPTTQELEQCPVCRSPFSIEEINKIKNDQVMRDLSDVIKNERELVHYQTILGSEIEGIKKKIIQIKTDITENQELSEKIKSNLHSNIPSIDEVRQKIDLSQKNLWQTEKEAQELETIKKDLLHETDKIKELEKDLEYLTKQIQNSTESVNKYEQEMSLPTPLDNNIVATLKNDEKFFRKMNEIEFEIEKSLQLESFHTDQANKLSLNLTQLKEVISNQDKATATLKHDLEIKLGTKTAASILQDMTNELKEKTDLFLVKDKELRIQELKIKELQSRLISLDDIIKEIDLVFSKTLASLKEISNVEFKPSTEEIALIVTSFKNFDLKLSDPIELFIPIHDLIINQKEFHKNKTTELKMELASLKTKHEAWERKQDKIKILELKTNDLVSKHQKKVRLYEVLGKDELRTFVLSIVEENLIIQTNEELQKLCQGRYEIIHFSKSNKMTPEFFIMDKFRDGGVRKISTLSGGETFMVSLAMAIGLAEMTRGKAEIDSLFIDEGFGTLDSESLHDVLDVLKQIQTRGLMIGVISHIKELTTSIPVNLNVIKAQDGNSSLRIAFN